MHEDMAPQMTVLPLTPNAIKASLDPEVTAPEHKGPGDHERDMLMGPPYFASTPGTIASIFSKNAEVPMTASELEKRTSLGLIRVAADCAISILLERAMQDPGANKLGFITNDYLELWVEDAKRIVVDAMGRAVFDTSMEVADAADFIARVACAPFTKQQWKILRETNLDVLLAFFFAEEDPIRAVLPHWVEGASTVEYLRTLNVVIDSIKGVRDEQARKNEQASASSGDPEPVPSPA